MTAQSTNPAQLIDDDFLKGLFPPGRDDDFFEALYGGAEDGAFNIALTCEGFDEKNSRLYLEFRLTERPGKCMACSLTYGLPSVFERHPTINLKGMVERIGELLAPAWRVKDYTLGSTLTKAPKVNAIPVTVRLEPSH